MLAPCSLRGADGLWRSLVSALRSGRRGPRFKSGQPDSKVPVQGVTGTGASEAPAAIDAGVARTSAPTSEVVDSSAPPHEGLDGRHDALAMWQRSIVLPIQPRHGIPSLMAH